ncbi:MAG: hypothetical protein JNJ57_11325, partial [Saprospiraceae bacterium]|nr:hypothetical protein [Saprospiraceae bacterium]
MKIAIVNHKNLSRARNGAVPASDNTTPKDETPIAELLKEAFAEFDQEDIEKQIQEIR